jgi:hypothetical protein
VAWTPLVGGRKELDVIGSLRIRRRAPGDAPDVECGKIQPGKLVHGTVRIEKAGDVLATMGPPARGTRLINQR